MNLILSFISLIYLTIAADAKIRQRLQAPSGKINYPPNTIVKDVTTPPFYRKFINGRYAIWYKDLQRSSTISIKITNMKIAFNKFVIQGATAKKGQWKNVGPQLTGSRGMVEISFSGYAFLRIVLWKKKGNFMLTYKEDLCGSPDTKTLSSSCSNGFVGHSTCTMTCKDPGYAIFPTDEPYEFKCNEQKKKWQIVGGVKKTCEKKSGARNFNNRTAIILEPTRIILHRLDETSGTVSFPSEKRDDKPDPFYLVDAPTPYRIWYKELKPTNRFNIYLDNIDVGNNTIKLEGALVKAGKWTPLVPPISGKQDSKEFVFEGYQYFRMVLDSEDGEFTLDYVESYCPDISDPMTEMTNCTNGLLYNSVCSMGCRNEAVYKLMSTSTHTCLLHGMWETTGVTVCEPDENIAKDCILTDHCEFTTEELLEIFEPQTTDTVTDETEEIELEEFGFFGLSNDSIPFVEELGLASDRGLTLGGPDKEQICTNFCKWSTAANGYRPQCNSYWNAKKATEELVKKLCLYCRTSKLCTTYQSVF